MKVFIVTSTDLGWDCIVGCFLDKDEATKCAESCGEAGILHEKEVEDKYEE